MGCDRSLPNALVGIRMDPNKMLQIVVAAVKKRQLQRMQASLYDTIQVQDFLGYALLRLLELFEPVISAWPSAVGPPKAT